MHRTLVALATTVACLIVAPAALAWHSTPGFLSCGEADFYNVSAETGWKTTVIEDGVVTSTKVFDVTHAGTVSIPVFSTLGAHYVQVTLANAASPNDGKSEVHGTLIDCVAPAGTPGPAGPAGSPGTNGKDSNSATSMTTVIIHDAPKVCTSKRSYAFRVRKTYMGRRIVGVKATEPGIKVTVRKSHGRFVVSWSTKGRTYTPGGIFRSVTVNATLAGKKHVRLQWDYRPCMASDGTLNDPSAAGQGTGGGA